MRIDGHLLKRFEPLRAYVFSGAHTELALSNLMDERLVLIIALDRVHDQFALFFPILTVITWSRGPVAVTASREGILPWWRLRHVTLRLWHP